MFFKILSQNGRTIQQATHSQKNALLKKLKKKLFICLCGTIRSTDASVTSNSAYIKLNVALQYNCKL